MATNACREQRQEGARYVQATPKVAAQEHTWASALDATRLSGRDWQCSSIFFCGRTAGGMDVCGALARTSCVQHHVPLSQKLHPCLSKPPFSTCQKFALCHFSEFASLCKHVVFLIRPLSSCLLLKELCFRAFGLFFIGIIAFLVARCCAVHHQVQGDCTVRGRFCTSAVKDEERVQWKIDVRAFLLDCKEQDLAEEDRVMVGLPYKIDRLSAFHATHMTDRQLQVAGIPGCKFFHKHTSDDGKPIEHRARLVERAGSFVVICTKVQFLLQHKSQLFPVWEFFHKRHNMLQACFRVAQHSAPDGGLRNFPGAMRSARVLEAVHARGTCLQRRRCMRSWTN